MKRINLSCAAALGLALVASTATAGSPTVVLSTRVAYHDLDLSTPAGVTAMTARIRAAATRLCRQTYSPIFPRASADEYRCRSRTLARTASLLGAPLVTARLHLDAAELAALK
jgi:UrcA family protein